MEGSRIGWTHHTWNPWRGCNRVSEACKFCYIEPIMKRSGIKQPFLGPQRCKSTWRDPVKWNRKAETSGERYRVFTCSMSDFFHPGADPWRAEAWDVIRDCQHLDWLILTKRPELIADRLPGDWGPDGYPHVWMGVTVELQKHLPRVDILSRIPAAIRFVSAEPLLGPVRFGRRIQHLDWVITGCERAARARRRTMDMDWVRSIRDECDAAGVPLFHKQYYSGTTLTDDGFIDGEVRQDFPQSAVAELIG